MIAKLTARFGDAEWAAAHGSVVRGEVVAGTGGVLHARPPGRDDLGPGVERHALGAIDVRVAEDRVLPSTEGVVGHRYGDRHIDTYHANLDPPLEPPRSLAAGGEDGGAVSV